MLLLVLVLTLTGFWFEIHANADSVNLTNNVNKHLSNSTLDLNRNTVPFPEALISGKATAQPVDPVEMNSVNLQFRLSSTNVIGTKTIHAEKQTFACSRINDPIGFVYNYKDLLILTEVTGCMSGESFSPCGMDAKVDVCKRNSTGEILTCYSPPLRSSAPPMTRCTEQTPVLPLEMNSLVSQDQSDSSSSAVPVKSILAEKYSYNCIYGNSQIPNRIKEVITFTFVVEQQVFFKVFSHWNRMC